MLEITDIDLRYGSIRAVRGASLRVARGELVGLIGPNGAGKSTLLKCIAGLLKPSGGRVELDGGSIAGWAPERIVAQGVALVPEGRRILGSLTVGENLQLGASTPAARAGLRESIDAAIERFPVLGERFGQQAGLLSGGQQQQLAIARALMSRPRLLLLDEPSLGLSPIAVDEVFTTLEALRADGVTLLLVEQKSKRTLAVADRTYLMRGGSIVREGGADLLEGGDLLQSYLTSTPAP